MLVKPPWRVQHAMSTWNKSILIFYLNLKKGMTFQIITYNQGPLRPTHGWDQMKVTERIRTVCSCFCERAPCEFCHLSCFFCQIKRKNACSLQPDFRFWKDRFAGKQCAQIRLVITHCWTAPHSSNHKDSCTCRCCFATSVSQKVEIKGRWGRLTGEIKWKWQKELEQFAVVFANGQRAKFAICRSSFAKSKERTRTPARFPVLKGPICRQTVHAKQAGHFSLFDWPTVK